MPNAIPVPADELEKLRADAARYRWLREEWANRKWRHVPIGNNDEADDITSVDAIDDAIDRSMASEPDDDPDYVRQDRHASVDEEKRLDDRDRARDQNAVK